MPVPKQRRRPKTREEYTLEQLSVHFPNGEWVDDPLEREAEVVEAPGCDPEGSGFESRTSPSVAVIGGQKYDAEALSEYLRELPEGTTIYVGEGRGVESDLAKSGDERVQVVSLDPDRYGKHARKVNVPDVLIQDLNAPIVLVGSGERVKQAKSWLKMVNDHRSPENRREVVEL